MTYNVFGGTLSLTQSINHCGLIYILMSGVLLPGLPLTSPFVYTCDSVGKTLGIQIYPHPYPLWWMHLFVE